jgi:hypothetical protein
MVSVCFKHWASSPHHSGGVPLLLLLLAAMLKQLAKDNKSVVEPGRMAQLLCIV